MLLINSLLTSGAPPRLGTLGIIGGGQLALMLARAASQLGVRTRIIESSPECPAHREVADFHQGKLSSAADLAEFAAKADIITLENEFVASSLLAGIEATGKQVWPSSKTMALVQDKMIQKQTLVSGGVPVVTFLPVDAETSPESIGAQIGYPFVLKRRTLGYDGTGNYTVHSAAEWPAALAKLGKADGSLYAEKWCPFERELAVIVTRSAHGEHAIYPVVETVQRNHVCEQVLAPAQLPAEVAEQAGKIALKAVESVDGVGSFGVEFFLLPGGQLLVNEMAPRVHNSGHYTIEACACSQFENHVRAVLGLPLGSARMRAPAAMVNLLAKTSASGAPHGIEKALAVPGAAVHLYGKLEAKPGRKMGHITALGSTVDEALAAAQKAADAIQFDLSISA